jgi:DNA end-binding protein Ku
MPARAIWKGVLRIGKLSVPTTLHAAIEDAGVHFHMLHATDEVRVRERMVNPATGETREDGQIRKGYEIEPGAFVLLDEDELAGLVPEASRDIEIHSCVPKGAIGAAWYERPYFLAPAANREAYFALAAALEHEERIGVARWVMRKRRYNGAVMAHDGHLALVTLRSQGEVLRAPRVEPMHRAADARELAMAEHLVSALAGKFDPSEFSDTHRERVLDFIHAKARGKKPKLAKAPRHRPMKSLTAALAASLEHVQKERKSA